MANKYDLIPAKVGEMLRRWDAGESVWSLEMGGLGPGYEQCIQMLVMEIIRDEKDKPIPEKPWGDWGEAAVKRLAPKLGFSGAQVGAAKSLASCLIKKGPKKFFEELKGDRKDDMIQVSKNFPSLS